MEMKKCIKLSYQPKISQPPAVPLWVTEPLLNTSNANLSTSNINHDFNDTVDVH